MAFAEFLLGTGALAFAALADPRRELFRLRGKAEAVPADATFEPLARVALAGTYPSTVAVTALTAVSLAFDAKLGAVLAGALTGMGLAAVVTGGQLFWRERVQGVRLYVERGTRRLFTQRLDKSLGTRR